MKPNQTWKLETRVASIQKKIEHTSQLRVSGQKWLCEEFWSRWQEDYAARLAMVVILIPRP